jgi:hypothetical protein
MKFKQFLAQLADQDGFIPTAHLRWVIRSNTRNTAREEAIAAEVIRQANPRENITGSFPWGPEQSMILQQLWRKTDGSDSQWRDVTTHDADKLFSTHQTKQGPLPVPNTFSDPEEIQPNFKQRLAELLGDDYDETSSDDLL